MSFPELLDDDSGMVVSTPAHRPTLSPTALGAYEICLRRGQYYQDPNIPSGPPNGSMARGSAWHRGLEMINNKRQLFGPDDDPIQWVEELRVTVSNAFAEVITQPDFAWAEGENFDSTSLDLAKIGAAWEEAPRNRWAGEGAIAEVLFVEEQLYVEDFGLTHDFNGYADVIYDIPILGHVGVDHKTTSKLWGGEKAAGDPRKFIQAPLYAEAYELKYDHPMNWFVFDNWTVGGKFQRVWVPTAKEVRAPFIERWRHITETIETHRAAGLDLPTNPGHILCSEKWCPFWDICPMGSTLTDQINIAYQKNGVSQP